MREAGIASSGLSMDRRRFLGTAVGGVLALKLTTVAAHTAGPRELSFYHTHTGENLRVEYHDGVQYLPDALKQITFYLRDFRTGDIHPIDPGVLDILHALCHHTVGRTLPFHIISAYRSPKTNAMLRKKSHGVAKHSFHMQGKAVDIRLPGCDTRHLYRTAVGLQRGGVGYYAKSDFIHVDTGRVRTWRG